MYLPVPDWLPEEYRHAWRALGDFEDAQVAEVMDVARRLRVFTLRELCSEAQCNKAIAERAIALLRCSRWKVDHRWCYKTEADCG